MNAADKLGDVASGNGSLSYSDGYEGNVLDAGNPVAFANDTYSYDGKRATIDIVFGAQNQFDMQDSITFGDTTLTFGGAGGNDLNVDLSWAITLDQKVNVIAQYMNLIYSGVESSYLYGNVGNGTLRVTRDETGAITDDLAISADFSSLDSSQTVTIGNLPEGNIVQGSIKNNGIDGVNTASRAKIDLVFASNTIEVGDTLQLGDTLLTFGTEVQIAGDLSRTIENIADYMNTRTAGAEAGYKYTSNGVDTLIVTRNVYGDSDTVDNTLAISVNFANNSNYLKIGKAPPFSVMPQPLALNEYGTDGVSPTFLSSDLTTYTDTLYGAVNIDSAEFVAGNVVGRYDFEPNTVRFKAIVGGNSYTSKPVVLQDGSINNGGHGANGLGNRIMSGEAITFIKDVDSDNDDKTQDVTFQLIVGDPVLINNAADATLYAQSIDTWLNETNDITIDLSSDDDGARTEDDIIVPIGDMAIGTSTVSLSDGTNTGTFTYGGIEVSDVLSVDNPMFNVTDVTTAFSGGMITDNHGFAISSGYGNTTFFIYIADSPDAAVGEFNSVATLIEAINSSVYYRAKLENNTMYISAADADLGLTFINLNSTNFMHEFGFANVAASGGTARFASLTELDAMIDNIPNFDSTLTTGPNAKITVSTQDGSQIDIGGISNTDLLSELGLTTGAGGGSSFVGDTQQILSEDVRYSINEDNDFVIGIDQLLADGGVADIASGTIDIESITIRNAVNGTVEHIDAETGEITFKPDADYNGFAIFAFNASDDQGNDITGNVYLEVLAINDDVAASDVEYTIDEDSSFVVAVDKLLLDSKAEDVDGDSIEIISVQDAVNGTVEGVNTETGEITFKPNANYHGLASFTFTISDSRGGDVTRTVNLDVQPGNDAPVANKDTKTISAGESETIDVRANDTDIDGDWLIITGVNGSEKGLINGSIIAGANFSIWLDSVFSVADGVDYDDALDVFMRVFHGNIENLKELEGEFNIAGYRVEKYGDAVHFLEEAPTGDISIISDSGRRVSAAVILAALALSGAEILAQYNAQYTKKVLYSANNGQFAFLGEDETFVETFIYTVSDDSGGADIGISEVTIIGKNDPVIASDVSYVINEDSNFIINIAKLLEDSSAMDADGDTIEIISVQDAVNGTVKDINTDTGEIIFTPDANYHGLASFTFTISDNKGGDIIKTVNLNVTAVNDDITASDISYDINEDSNFVISVDRLLLDSGAEDVDGDTIEIISVQDAVNGIVADINTDTGEIIFTPYANYHGIAGFTFTISDNKGGNIIKTVNLNVAAVNDGIIADNVSYDINEGSNFIINIAKLLEDSSAMDADGDSVEIISVQDAMNGTVENINTDTGEIIFTPDANYHGLASFTFTISDNQGGDITKTVTLDVTPVNTASGEDIYGASGESDLLQGTDGDDVLHYNADAVWDEGFYAVNMGSPDDIVEDGEVVYIHPRNRSYDAFDGGEGYDIIKLTDEGDALVLYDGNGSTPLGDGKTHARIVDVEEIHAGGGDDLVDFTAFDFEHRDVKIKGEDGHDVLWSSSGDDVIEGGDGDDNIDGGSGDDDLFGGEGDDKLHGRNGNDTIHGGLGADVIFTGLGEDSIDYSFLDESTASNRDVISDFDKDNDTLNFEQLVNEGIINLDELTVTQDQEENNTIISANDNDFEVELLGLFEKDDIDFGFG